MEQGTQQHDSSMTAVEVMLYLFSQPALVDLNFGSLWIWWCVLWGHAVHKAVFDGIWGACAQRGCELVAGWAQDTWREGERVSHSKH